MTRLIRWLLSLIGTIAILTTLCILIARGVGDRVPLSMAIWFTNPDGSACPTPCLFGVRPGVTDRETAIRTLQAHPFSHDFDLITLIPFRLERDGGSILMISFNTTPDGIIDEITLLNFVRYVVPLDARPSPAIGTLGEVVALFGAPEFVQLSTGGDPTFLYGDKQLIFSVGRAGLRSSGGLSVTMPISRFTVYRRAACSGSAFPYVFLEWRGLTTLPRYYAGASLVTTPIQPFKSAGFNSAPCLAR